MKKGIKIGDISILLSTVFWGCISIFTRPLLAVGFASVQIVAIRAVITTLIMLTVILIKDPKLLKIRLRDIWMFIGTGILSFLFFNICYMSSIGENSVSVACILMYTSAIWVTLLSVPIFKEKLTFIKVAALVIALGGSCLLCLSSSLKVTAIGLVFGLLSGLGYALYSIFGKFAAAKYSTFTTIFYTFLFAAIAAVPICKIESAVPLLSDTTNTLLCVGVSIFGTALPYILYTFGLSKTEAGKASVLSITEPVVASIVGMLVFSEMLGITGVIGIITVIFGLVLLEKKK